MGAAISIGASVAASVITGLTWCFCTACGSLCNSCCGNDKPSTIAPSISSGRKRSAFLLFLSVALAFVFQYALAPALGENSDAINTIPKVGPYLIDSWTSGCQADSNSDWSTEAIEALQERCRGNNGVYRVSGCSFLFFLLAAIGAYCKPSFNREAWPAKYVLFLMLVAATVFIPSAPLFSPIYMNIARVGGAIFIIVQQIILIDLAYNWNDSWVEKSNQAEQEEPGSGKKWLAAILVSCAILYIGSIVGIGILFYYFQGCAINNIFLAITLLLIVLATILQMTGDEASLLTSGLISAYAVYLSFASVSRNPNGECNPKLGEESIVNIVFGVGFTLLSLAWTGYSYTAETTLGAGDSVGGMEDNSLIHNSNPEEGPSEIKGVVTNSDGVENYGTNIEDGEGNRTNEADASSSVASWKLNLILVLVSCFFAMSLTGWGAIGAGGNAANPEVSKVSMWMIIASQWLMMLLYMWTVVAPRLLPDRDFS
mmetsp:Transcript_33257/g.48880  ORF Transcript_33257/g.48880 Transcript_33257/m.48880 type:complete len:485 (+) Transcript_33257:113-1567(+)|eukprot:CAMPEP_0195518610 /NCGR_PEP_ID=MMETSP0794_2-20130614/13308_1 /TAXON_ID=515487 /ORGANISM="Stephanopyxis turris, Strain CCMP 815" /LENGTH=484 /DNA_ID=CAMNT_0040647617 /DNA_START=71 /DNA_END=1525 /DNA_ORIENTATION=+